MKSTIVLIVTLCMFVNGYSQVDNTSFGLRAGVNFQNLNGKDANGNKLTNNLKTGFNIGVNAEIPIATDFYVQPGLLFSTKGAVDKSSFGNGSAKINLSYLEIPVNLIYKPVLGTGKMLLGFGPYVAFGVGGKVKFGGNSSSVKWKNTVTVDEYSSGNVYLKRIDAGGNLLVGYEFTPKLSAQLNAQLGLVNINPKVQGFNNKSTLKNTGFGVSVGYRL